MIKMAKELLSAKVETSIKEQMNELTQKYKEQGLINEVGDLYTLAADLLERQLTIQTPRAVVGIDHLDQLISQINRLFMGMIDQNNISMNTLKIEFEEKILKDKQRIDSLLEEKQELKEQLTNSDTRIKELTGLTTVNQEELNNLRAEKEKNDKYIARLEKDSEQQEIKIKQQEQFEKQNQELVIESKQKSEEIRELLNQIKASKIKAEQQTQAHQNEIRELQFQQKEALFNKEKEHNEKYNKDLAEIRQKQADSMDKHEERVSNLQDKYNKLLADKQRIEALYEALKENNKPKGNKPSGNK